MAPTSAEPIGRLRAFADVLTTWLEKWARLYSLPTGRTDLGKIPEETFAVYAEALEDLTPKQLEAASRAATQACRFFPTPADIRAQIQQADGKGLQIEAEAAWEWALDVARRYYFADLGGLRDAPLIPPPIEFAVAACGGWRRLHTCGEDELTWCRKTFLERYVTLHEARQVEHLLTNREAKDILTQLSRPPEPRRLAAPENEQPRTTGLEPSEEEVRAGFAALREKLGMRPTAEHRVLSQEEWDRRRAALKLQAEKLLADHAVHDIRAEPAGTGDSSS